MTTSSSSTEPSSDQIHSGPVHKRSCTNPCFLAFFILFLAGWAGVFFFAARYGDPERIIYPSDSEGRICGRNELAEKPYLFFFNILKCAKLSSVSMGCNTTMVCVKRCPDYTLSFAQYKTPRNWEQLTPNKKVEIRDKLICKYHVQPQIENIPQLLENRSCASVYFKGEPMAGRCIPIALRRFNGRTESESGIMDDLSQPLLDENANPVHIQEIKETTKGLALTIKAKAIIERVINDLAHSWKFILCGLVAGMLVSFFWIILMQVIAGFMVWTSMLAMIVLSAVAFHGCFKQYRLMSGLSDDDLDRIESDRWDQNLDIDMTSLIKVQLESILSNRKVWLLFTILTGTIFFILFITFIFLRKRVRIAISLIREASKAIWHAKFALVFPIFPYLFQLLVILFFGFTALLIAAASKPSYRYTSGPKYGLLCDPDLNETSNDDGITCQKAEIVPENYSLAAHLYNFFGLLWLLFFISGLCKVIFAGAFSRYYWTWNKRKDIPQCLILSSTYTAIRYHMGSVALGSFLLATVNFIRAIIEYIDHKCRQYPNNELVRVITCIFRGCFWCLDKFLRFLNTNAYIMIAIYGKGFFSSAKDAFSLLLDNIVRVVVIDQVADYLLFMGKLAVTSIVGVTTFYISTGKVFPEYIGHLLPHTTYNWVPVLAICIGTYLIACTFFSVYDMAVDTIFLCFLKDCKINDGSPEKPFFMSKELLHILNYKNKLIHELSKHQRQK